MKNKHKKEREAKQAKKKAEGVAVERLLRNLYGSRINVVVVENK